MFYFCTYCDGNYAARLLAMYESLGRYCHGGFRLFVLCLDAEMFSILAELKLPGVEAVPAPEMEAEDPGLRAAKETRSKIEYYFTCTPSFTLFVLNKHPDVDTLIYLDADIYFYSPLDPLIKEIAEASVGIIPHRFSPIHRSEEVCGIYNVAFLFFRRDEFGLSCLRWWRERCLEWCFDRVEDGRYADQKYLDEWPARFGGVCVVRNKGADLAPWNVDNHTIVISNGRVRVDDDDLIFYHFQGYNVPGWGFVDPGIVTYRGYRIDDSVVSRIHLPYAKAVAAARRRIADLGFRRQRLAGTCREAQMAKSRRPFTSLVRLYLEGKVMFAVGNHVFFIRSAFARFVVRAYDACKGRGTKPPDSPGRAEGHPDHSIAG